MDELGKGKLVKLGGAALAILGVVLGGLGTSKLGMLVVFAALVVVGAVIMKIGDRLEKQAVAASNQRSEQ